MTGHDDALTVSGLTLELPSESGLLTILDDVSFSVRRGETLGIVGESGSGKSMTALSIMGLVGRSRGHRVSGSIRAGGRELLDLSEREWRGVRGNSVAMVFQEPMTSLDPSFTIGAQIIDGIRAHRAVARAEARRRAVEVLDLVRIPHAAARLSSYPHEFSGGMRQRVLIAMALANSPDLLIADEPTTALDVSIQAQILELLGSLQRELGLSILFITHNMGVVAELCDRVAVMYSGHVVEEGTAAELFADPRHPYTRGLLAAMPRVDRRQELAWVRGTPPDPARRPAGCRFAPRCDFHVTACDVPPPLVRLGEGRAARCVRVTELETPGARDGREAS